MPLHSYGSLHIGEVMEMSEQEETSPARETLELRGRLEAFEQQYQLVSDEFYRQYEAGLLGDSADFLEWSAFYDMWRSSLRAGVERTRRNLQSFEQRYGVTTAKFLQEMAAEDLAGGDLEYVEWAGEAN
jgi:hypothetical protein